MWMCSELAVGHHRTGGGDRLEQPRTVPGGLLGADYEVANGRYRFKKVLGGLNWTPEPARASDRARRGREGRRVPARGERQGRAPAREPVQLLREHVGKIVELTVGPNADGSGLAHRAGGADRDRERAAQPRLGRGQPAARSTRRPAAASPTSTCRTPPRPATPTSSATSSRRPTRTPSSSTSGSTAAGRSPTTTSTSCGGRSSATGRCGTATT